MPPVDISLLHALYNSWTCSLLAPLITTYFVCFVIVRFPHLHSHFSLDATNSGPQKFHSTPTPRIGGFGLISGILAAYVVYPYPTENLVVKNFGLLIVSSLPAFLGGIIEDITKKVSVSKRLLLTMLSAMTAIWLLDGQLNRIDVIGLDLLMKFAPVAFVFTVFAVAGATNSINIIDGYNGLASGFSAIILFALGYISLKLGDNFLAYVSFSMTAALAGFVCWNWPSGKLFMGDGGAYFIGFWISEVSVLLLARHPNVSVWFPLFLMAYPVFETLFSIYRRKIKKNLHPGHPDSLHLHQLIYKRLVRLNITSKNPDLQRKRNSAVSPYIWIGTLCTSISGVIFFNSTHILALLTIGGCIIYTTIYRLIVKLKAPSFIVRKK